MDTEQKLDIFRVLKALDEKDVQFYQTLTDKQIKELQPFLVARWLTGTYNKRQVFLINELVNPFLFSLYKHKGLLWNLMTICTSGKPQRYVWNKTLSKSSTFPNIVKIIQQYFGYSSRDAEKSIKLLSPDDIILIAEEMGWQDEDINKARKELGLPAVRIQKIRKKTTKITDPDLFEF